MNQPISYKRHYKELIYLGVPIMVGQLGTIILGFADTMMIGHHSAAELSAAGFVNTLFNLAIIFGLGFSYGLTPIVGALYGRGEEEEAGGKLKNSLLANLLIAVFLCIVMGILYLNLDKLGQPEELLPFIKPYYLILWASLPLIMLFNAFKQFADGITDTQTPMWILLGGNVLNIVGNYLLIYGTFGFPELGLLGGGLSTLFARLMMLVVFIGIFFLSPRYKTFLRGFRRSYANRADFRLLNKLGWPIALQMGMETASFSLCAIMLGWLGETPLAAHQIMNTITTLCFMIYYGMGAAIAVRVSYFRGQEDMPNLRRSAYAGFHLILVWGLFLCTIVFCIRHQLGSWYTDSEEVRQLVAVLVIPMLAYQFGDGLQIAFANALRGLADVKPMMYIAFVAYIILSLPTSYIFGFLLDWGTVGIWMGFPIGLTSAGIAFYLRFRQQTRTNYVHQL
ncbi:MULTISPECIES: MATE family efflux transporter [Mediterranea]|uniref:MATE family efflux transporter n=1 Tax=Mediterranea TaxID=1926659 RepID=UPI002011A07E|nr:MULTISPECIES: MATE family efflux transporter [Mediterranea]MCL1606209.1 MATE family efflux transporter [Mediterranea sp. ET5]MDM8121251.1 MATE family efflux transporter [Mediterranea massiliensis]MDM8198009.1 MATE family efflux transporter [Mediterranea massiliensis]